MIILENITMKEFKKYLKQTRTIVFPFGAIEEHGSHLPLNTDSLIIQEVLKLVSKKKKFFPRTDSSLWCMYDNERTSGYYKHYSRDTETAFFGSCD